ncbi:MAG: polymerase, sigma-24 subunit, subfamily, partial [bacterium]|nr:polymerase, sigma-24 subunit, subfamily [bacterium]
MADELERATLSRCRRGDAAAFRALVERYQDRVYALAVALAGSDGEDITQETFVRVHGALGGFDPDGPARLGAWILTIARRLCTDRA